jgi:hypothetical protein
MVVGKDTQLYVQCRIPRINQSTRARQQLTKGPVLLMPALIRQLQSHI